ncbi:MAG: hypothetical protein AB1705_01895 [Verrucomicrobiota bacterium]
MNTLPTVKKNYLGPLFLSLQVVLVVSWLGLAIVLRRAHERGALDEVFGVTFCAAMVALLFGSPYLLESHRRIGLCGWLLGFIAFVSCLFVPAR